MRLPSGAGHDAGIMAKHCPSGMIFLRCKDGISHNPAESITVEDADLGVRALLEAVRRLDRRLLGTGPPRALVDPKRIGPGQRADLDGDGAPVGDILWVWGEAFLRWLHVIAGIAWIGTSFYFIHLDYSLKRREGLPPGAYGEAWQVHGGGFYNMVKYLVAPARLPAELTWFKWEAYATWVSGFALVVAIYYAQASLYLIDPAVLDISPAGRHRHQHRRAGAGLAGLRRAVPLAARPQRGVLAAASASCCLVRARLGLARASSARAAPSCRWARCSAPSWPPTC